MSKVYHISAKPLTGVLTPRIPKSSFEDQNTPRICFAKTIQGCLVGVYEDAIKKVVDHQFYVYSTDHAYYEPKKKKEVADAQITEEVWIKDPIIPKFEGIIKINRYS